MTSLNPRPKPAIMPAPRGSASSLRVNAGPSSRLSLAGLLHRETEDNMGNSTGYQHSAQFNRLAVWRAYHKMEAELGRVPYGNEMAADILAVNGVSLSGPVIMGHCHALPSCKVHKRRGMHTDRVVQHTNPGKGKVKDAYDFMMKGM